jgi:glycosyltransferase involved in cell wall biosynthesis
MLIGFDAKRAFRNNTGLGNYSRGVIGGVMSYELRVKSEAGTVVLYTPSVKGRYEHFFENMPLRVVEPKGVWKVMKSVWRSVGVSRAVKKDGVELFHGLSHELPYGLPKGVKKIVTMHDLIVFRFPEFFKPADRVIHRLKMRHACRVADVVVAISEQTKCDLMEFLEVPEEKIRVVYQSCDSAFWGVKGSEEGVKGSERTNVEVREKYGLPERYILCVGTLEERKNQLRVIEAMKRLPEDVALVLVGRPRGDYGQRVLACTNERVRVLSGASFTDFPSLYRGAVASVYLSRFEGFGIPVLESMCCDCPVVTSDVSSMPEAGGEAALYAAPEDVDTVAAHLLRLCTDEAFRQERIEKGRLQRRKFAPEKVSADMMEVYKSLL